MTKKTTVAVRDTDSWTDILPSARMLSEDVCNTEFVPKALRGSKQKVLACVMTGRELGIPPMQSLGTIDVIDGKASLSARGMLALIRQAGHQVRQVEAGNQRVTFRARRLEDRDDPEAWETYSYTAEEARIAGLLGKTNWQRDRQAMLSARAITRMARVLFPDVIMGLQTSEVAWDGDSDPAQVHAEVVETVTVEKPSGVPTIKPSQKPARRAASQSRQVKTQADKPSLSLADIEDDSASQETQPAEDTADDDILDAEIVDDATGEITEAPEAVIAEMGAVEMITDAQLKKLKTMLGKAGIEDRDEGLQYYKDVLGHEVERTRALTMAEARRVIDSLETLLNPPQEPEDSWG